MVRIHLPPAESQVRTCLSREFAFLRREAAVFRGCTGWGERRLSTETRKVQQHRAEERSVSVERYSSTAVSPMRFATVGEKPRLSAVVRAGTSGLGRQRHAGRGNMWPKGGDISVG